MTSPTAISAGLFIGGEGDTQFTERVVPSFEERGFHLMTTNSRQAAMDYLTTRNINFVVLSFNLDETTTQNIVAEIRKKRPQILILAMTEKDPRGFRNVVAENFYWIARDANIAITINEIEQAIRNMELQCAKPAPASAITWVQISVVLVGITAVIILAFLSGSTLGRFLGALWATVLLAELLYLSLKLSKKITLGR